MNRAFITRYLGSLLLLLSAGMAARAESPRVGQPYLLIVGISNYNDKQILPRAHAEDDAKALFDLFTSKESLGVSGDHARLLLGSDDASRNARPATRENLLKGLAWLQENAKENDLVILAFIGEAGTMDDLGEKLCYFTVDSTVKNRAKDSVSASEIAAILDKLKSRKFCSFVDVNYKGFTPEKGKAPEPNFSEDGVFKEFLGDNGEGKEHQGAAAGRVLFTASYGKNPSPDLAKHGLFTEVLLEGLKGAADKDGYEADGLVTVDELSKYFGEQLQAKYRQIFKGADDKRPVPGVFGGSGGHFVLSYNPAALARSKGQQQKLDELLKDNKLNEKFAVEGRDLLGRMPKLESYRSLRKLYQELIDGKITAKKFEEDRQEIFDKMKISQTDSLHFAKIVMDAAAKIKKEYYKDLDMTDLVGWAAKGMYRRLEEKIPKDIQEDLDRIKEMKETELLELLVKVRKNLGVREDLANHKDIDIALQRMTGHLDPYTSYFDAKARKELEKVITGKFKGVGIQIRKDLDRDQLRVISPLRGSPAYRAKIMAGDIITQVTNFVDENGKELPAPVTVETKGMPLNDAVQKILGLKGTDVELTIEREGEKEPLKFRLTRDTITVESVLGFKRKDDDSWDYMVDPKSKIAYIRLTDFTEDAASDMEKLVSELSKQGIKGLVLDLRNNPGGLLSGAVSISDLFIDDGLIVSVRKRKGEQEKYRGQSKGSYLDFPMVCMINGNSASASEIVSACLQDHKRAIIVGERSFGKGTVQNMDKFDDGLLKMTIATFWRPNGKNLSKSSTSGRDDEDWGVRPDPGFEVKLSREEQDDLVDHFAEVQNISRRDRPEKNPKPEFKDRQLDKALEYLRGQVKMARSSSDKK